MTSDGISDEDWATIQQLAEALVHESTEAANTTSDSGSDIVINDLHKALDRLEAKYGHLPSITATKADYVNDISEREALLKRAYNEAIDINDRTNLTLVSSSLTEFYLEESISHSEARRWLSALEDALGNQWDDIEYQTMKSFRVRLA